MMRGSRKCGGILHLLLQAGWLAESVKGRFIASFLYRPLTPYLILYNGSFIQYSSGFLAIGSLRIILLGQQWNKRGLLGMLKVTIN